MKYIGNILQYLSHPVAPRVALFTDSYHEANGVATVSRQLASFAQAHSLPFLVVHGGTRTQITQDGSLTVLELKRGLAAFPLDKGLYCDPMLSRFKRLATGALRDFKPDLVQITGPGDLGFLGLWVAHGLKVPLVASWHTNLHEYVSRRLERLLWFLPRPLRARTASAAEQQSLRGLLRFYRMARVILAPNDAMTELLHRSTGKPAFHMAHGVDLAQYSPRSAETSTTGPFCIGYVGRMTTEKNVRFFVDLERRLRTSGIHDFRFLLVGEGGQRAWLKKNLTNAELPGVLRGEELARAYQKMDAFVFPSLTDTFGLVMLEAMASGVPVLAAPQVGLRAGIKDGISGCLTEDFTGSLMDLIQRPGLRRCMGLAAIAHARSLSWEAVFQSLYRTYSEAFPSPVAV